MTDQPKDKQLDTIVIRSEFEGMTYEEKLNFMNIIATPVASRKLAKRLYKCIKKTSKVKTDIRQGVKEVQRFIRRGEKGIVVLAGNVSPIDLYSHIPVVCEDNGIPYVFVPSKEDLGSCLGTNRAISVLMLKPSAENKKLYDKCYEATSNLPRYL